MKIVSRGFVAPLILVAIALILAGLAYMYMQNKISTASDIPSRFPCGEEGERLGDSTGLGGKYIDHCCPGLEPTSSSKNGGPPGGVFFCGK